MGQGTDHIEPPRPKQTATDYWVRNIASLVKIFAEMCREEGRENEREHSRSRRLDHEK